MTLGGFCLKMYEVFFKNLDVFVMVRRMLLFFIVTAIVNLAWAVPAQETGHTDFSGTWALNLEESDSMPGMGGGRRGGMGGGRRGGGGRGGGGRGGGETSQNREVTLVISQESDLLNIVREGGPQGGQMEMVLTPGGEPQEISTPGGTATVSAWWEESQLIVQQIQERQTPRGNMTIEQEQRWELSEDGNTLIQRIKMKTPRGEMDLTLVFDRQ